jgi:REP element-mobilizing transposase RayT
VDTDERRRRIRTSLDARPSRPELAAVARSLEVRSLAHAERDSIPPRRRRPPHRELAGFTYFVTFRVARGRGHPFDLPAAPVAPRAEFVGQALQPARLGPPGLAEAVEEAVLFRLGSHCDIDAYVVMPDHVHLLITPTLERPLSAVLQGIRGSSARAVNTLRGTAGRFWQDESFDHLIRNEADWLDKRDHILQNPVVAGLAPRVTDYPFTSAVTLDPPGRREELLRLLAQS